MEIFSKPGSRTVYSTAKRTGLPSPSDCPPDVGPASYTYDNSCIPHRQETVAPFDTTAIRNELKLNGFPSPAEYFPNQRPRHQNGTPLIGAGPRFREDDYCSDNPGPIYKIPDAWDKMVYDINMMNTTKRPRAQYEKFVSNNAPSVFHPMNIKEFVEGIDGRMYPLWIKRTTLPGPKYNVAEIYTSQSPGPYHVDFKHVSQRKPIFESKPGFGPADFNTRLRHNSNGGIFLSQTDDEKASIPRLFDLMMCHEWKNSQVSPTSYYPKAPSPKAVQAPFKSTVPLLGYSKKQVGPGPADYFENKPRMEDVYPPIIGYSFSEPPEKAPFDTTEERFCSMTHHEDACKPGPGVYNIYGFTDWMQYDLCRHSPARINPKLGFLTSAEARPDEIFKTMEITIRDRPYEIPGKWVNMRPKKIRTYGFHGPPGKSETPGPNAYDTRSAYQFLKGKKSWWNPRDYTGTGFDNSGCGRTTVLSHIDYDIPGPKYDCHSTFPGPGGYVKRSEKRFSSQISDDGPGPRHRPSAKTDSMWRATQLGTYNVFLKGIDRVCPTAGGYHPQGPLDALADKQRGLMPVDDYADEINPPTPIDSMVKMVHHSRKKTKKKRKNKNISPQNENEIVLNETEEEEEDMMYNTAEELVLNEAEEEEELMYNEEELVLHETDQEEETEEMNEYEVEGEERMMLNVEEQEE